MTTVIIILSVLLLLFAWALCAAAGQADRDYERIFNDYLKRKNGA